jgi:signal transduction histidine kinase
LEIERQDDGAGFDPQAVQPGHYGLLGMRERVRLAGGRLEIQSEAGKGTRLLIRFTLEDGNQTAVTGGGDTAGSSARIEETAGSDVKREETA